MRGVLGLLLRHPVRTMGSLRVTTALLLLAILVLFTGTLAAPAHGVAAVHRRFFDSWGTMVGPLPVPGLRLLATAAGVNLLFAFLRRRRPRPRQLGLGLVHAGLVAAVVVLVGAAAAAPASSDLSFVALREGARVETSLDPGAWDLVLDPAGIAVPFERLRDGSNVPGEPSVVVEQHLANSRPLVGPSGDALTSLAPLRPEADPAENRPGVILRPSSGGRTAPTVVWAGRTAAVTGAAPSLTAKLARREERLPFAMTLKDLQISYYPQTETLQAVAARVMVEGAGSSAEALLGMNRPLRRAGLNVYVSSVRTDEAGKRVLVLGVSRSPVPLYAAFGLTVLGLALHLGLRLTPLAALLALSLLAPGPAGARGLPPLDALGRVAVLSDGRLMPLETYARLTLRELSGSAGLKGESALSWMARVLFAPDTALADPVFAVRRRETPGRLRLDGVSAGRVSFDQLEPAEARLQELAGRLSSRKDPQPADEEILSLMSRMALFTRLVASADYLRPHADFTVPAGPVSARLGLSPGRHSLREVAAVSDRLAGPWDERVDAAAARRLRNALARWADDYSAVVPAIIPLPAGWTNPVAALASGADDSGASAALGRAADAYAAGDWRAMRGALSELDASVTRAAGGADRLRAVRLELLYDRLRPFAVGIVMHCLGLLLLAAGDRQRRAKLISLSALALGLLAFSVGLVLQVLITARVPAATLAQTFVLAAWALSLAGLAAYVARRRRAALAVGCGAALLLAVVGRVLAASGDEFAVLPAALDTNLWLAAHAGLMSLGYAASLAAAALGHAWLARRWLRPDDVAGLDRLHAALRAALGPALLLTVAGTFAGAAWADIAWGRFWDWDPKENGALIVILWIAAILHSSRARLFRPAVTAGAAAALSLAVMFSWIGVNLMRVGLHSYGFLPGGGAAVAVACALEVAFLAAAAIAPRIRPRRVEGEGLMWKGPREFD